MAQSEGSRSAQPAGCMTQFTTSAVFIAGLLVAGAGVAAAEPAEFCVTCSGPNAQYRCAFSGEGATTLRPGLQLYCVSTLAKLGKHETCSVNRAAKPPCTGVLKVLTLPDSLAPVPEPPAKTAEPAPPPERSEHTPSERTVPSSQGGPPSADVEAKASDTRPGGVKPVWREDSGAASKTAAAPQPEAADASGQPPAQKPAGQDEPQSTAPALTKPLENAGKTVADAATTTGSILKKAGSAVGSAAKKSWKCLTSLFGDC